MVDINYMAVIVSAALSVVLGFIWYGPLFGKKWMALMNFPNTEKPPASEMVKPIIISIIGALFLNYALVHSLAYGNAFLDASGVGAGLMAAFWLWLGFIVPPHLYIVAWEMKPWSYFFISAGYWLVYLAIAASVLSLWV